MKQRRNKELLYARLGLIITAAVVFALGLVMIFNTSSAEILDQGLDQDTHRALFRQVAYALVGLGFAWVADLIGYRQVLRLSFGILIFFTIMLVLVFVPGIGVKVNGACRWVGFGGFTLQPSEFIKLFLPAWLVHAVLKEGGGAQLGLRRFLMIIGVMVVPLALILIEPDHSMTGIVATVAVSQCLLLGIRFRYWGVPLLCVVIAGGAFASQTYYVRDRLKVYWNPDLDIQGRGHQPHQAKIAAGAGGLFGRGPGRSLQKLSYLPEAQNDYIAAIYAEEFGFVGILGLISCYLIMALLGFHIAYHAADRQGFLLAGSLTVLLTVQTFINLGVVSGLLPSTGINLPLFSQGGSSLLANMIAFGLLINVSRHPAK